MNNICSLCSERQVFCKSLCQKCYKQQYYANVYNTRQIYDSESYKEYYHNNKDKISARHKKYYLLNREKLKEHTKQYHLQNVDKDKYWRQKYKNKKNARDRQKRLIDPTFKLRKNCCRAVAHLLKKNGLSKNRQSILDYLPYTTIKLKKHLESLFEPWMTWDNYGLASSTRKTWQIDHIIPQSKLPYSSMEDSNFKKCWALENLRPLETIQNIKKGNK